MIDNERAKRHAYDVGVRSIEEYRSHMYKRCFVFAEEAELKLKYASSEEERRTLKEETQNWLKCAKAYR